MPWALVWGSSSVVPHSAAEGGPSAGVRALVSLRGPGDCGVGGRAGQAFPLSTITWLLRSALYIRVWAGFKGKNHYLFIDFAFLITKENPMTHFWVTETVKVRLSHS